MTPNGAVVCVSGCALHDAPPVNDAMFERLFGYLDTFLPDVQGLLAEARRARASEASWIKSFGELDDMTKEAEAERDAARAEAAGWKDRLDTVLGEPGYTAVVAQRDALRAENAGLAELAKTLRVSLTQTGAYLERKHMEAETASHDAEALAERLRVAREALAEIRTVQNYARAQEIAADALLERTKP
jgi:hypothetical protein